MPWISKDELKGLRDRLDRLENQVQDLSIKSHVSIGYGSTRVPVMTVVYMILSHLKLKVVEETKQASVKLLPNIPGLSPGTFDGQD